MYDNDYSHDLEDDNLELDDVKSPSYFNISSRAPLHSNIELDSTLEDDILPLEEVLINEKKRKSEDFPEEEQKPSKVLKLWNFMKYPFQKITTGVSTNENELNISKAEVITEEETSVTPEIDVCENNSSNLETEEVNKSINLETETENNVSENTIVKQKFCSIM